MAALGMRAWLSGVACVYIASSRLKPQQQERQQQHGSATLSAAESRRRPLRRCHAVEAALRLALTAEEGGVRQYEVHRVTGDGRCLFRSVAAATAVASHSRAGGGGGRRQSEAEETVEADRLRGAAVDALVARRDEVEWFVEGDFGTYCRAMRMTSAWGGEPEILMLTHVTASPIEVFMVDRGGGGMRSIAHYGKEEYGEAQNGDGEEEGPGDRVGIAVLFHGAGHYEALSICQA